MRKLLILIVILLGLLVVISTAQQYLPSVFQNGLFFSSPQAPQQVKVVTEESVTIDIVKKAGPSVVTISGTASQQPQQSPPFDFGIQPFFGGNPSGSDIQPNQHQPQSILSGSVTTREGMII